MGPHHACAPIFWLIILFWRHIEKLAEKIQSHLPFEIIKAEFTQDLDKRDYIVSSQKFYDKGFECKYDLDVGIKQLITAYDIIQSPWYANYFQ